MPLFSNQTTKTIISQSMATITTSLSLRSGPKAPTATSASRDPLTRPSPPWVSCPWERRFGREAKMVGVARAAPDNIGEKVEESIKQAEEACSGSGTAGECAAAWDEVEELSAAVSHARDKEKQTDPLEEFCKDNPETDECRTYDN